MKNSYRVLICSLRFAAVTGGILSILTFLLGGVITKYVMGVELASYALRVLAPAIFLFALTGVLRGFFSRDMVQWSRQRYHRSLSRSSMQLFP